MGEVKTCEQYVLAELQKKNKECEELAANLERITALLNEKNIAYDRVYKDLKKLASFFEAKTEYDGSVSYSVYLYHWGMQNEIDEVTRILNLLAVEEE